MFFPGVADQVYIATGVTDMRKSINGLFHNGCRTPDTQSSVGASFLLLQPEAGYRKNSVLGPQRFLPVA